jgi:hypothetical protein
MAAPAGDAQQQQAPGASSPAPSASGAAAAAPAAGPFPTTDGGRHAVRVRFNREEVALPGVPPHLLMGLGSFERELLGSFILSEQDHTTVREGVGQGGVGWGGVGWGGVGWGRRTGGGILQCWGLSSAARRGWRRLTLALPPAPPPPPQACRVPLDHDTPLPRVRVQN